MYLGSPASKQSPIQQAVLTETIEEHPLPASVCSDSESDDDSEVPLQSTENVHTVTYYCTCD